EDRVVHPALGEGLQPVVVDVHEDEESAQRAEGPDGHEEQVARDLAGIDQEPDLAAHVVERLEVEDPALQLAPRARRPAQAALETPDHLGRVGRLSAHLALAGRVRSPSARRPRRGTPWRTW